MSRTWRVQGKLLSVPVDEGELSYAKRITLDKMIAIGVSEVAVDN